MLQAFLLIFNSGLSFAYNLICNCLAVYKCHFAYAYALCRLLQLSSVKSIVFYL